MVSPNASQHKEDKLLYPDHYLVWYVKVDSGPHRHVWLIGGMHGCSGGACVVAPGGSCMVALGGHAWLLPGDMRGI